MYRSFSWLRLCTCSVLLILALSACKAKMMETPIDDGTADMMMSLTCENMKCVDPDAVCCNGEPCVDTKSNPQHCGGCGKACMGQDVCADGRCVCRAGGRDVSCTPGSSCCVDRPGYTGGCKELQTDKSNCGSCGRSCRASETCNAGTCKCGEGAACSGSQACCGSGCADTTKDPNNCGMCGKKCAAGKDCKNGICDGECPGPCGMNETCCNGACVNLLNNPMNCGMCGKACPVVLGIPLPCIFGICFDPKTGDGGMAPDGGARDM